MDETFDKNSYLSNLESYFTQKMKSLKSRAKNKKKFDTIKNGEDISYVMSSDNGKKLMEIKMPIYINYEDRLKYLYEKKLLIYKKLKSFNIDQLSFNNLQSDYQKYSNEYNELYSEYQQIKSNEIGDINTILLDIDSIEEELRSIYTKIRNLPKNNSERKNLLRTYIDPNSTLNQELIKLKNSLNISVNIEVEDNAKVILSSDDHPKCYLNIINNNILDNQYKMITKPILN